MRRQALENRSMTVRMVVWPLELGKSVIKSMAMWDQGRCGMGRGWSRPAGNWREGFCVWQTWHWRTWVMVSFLSVGHQNLFCKSWIVAFIPGWPELRAVWTWSMVRLQRFSGTNSLSWGHSGGIACSVLAWSISVMISHWMGEMMIVGEITFSGWVSSEPFSNCQEDKAREE